MSRYQHILDQLPYGPGFCFVDSLEEVSDTSIIGRYYFRETASFYQDHFPQKPLTPGVLLVECMAQIGLVCLGIHLAGRPPSEAPQDAPPLVLTEAQVNYELPVAPGETVRVEAHRKYWRLGKLKCAVALFQDDGQRAVHGILAGMQPRRRNA